VAKAKYIRILIRAGKIILKIIAVLVILLLLMVGLINLPTVQTFITQKITERIKTDYNLDIRVGGVNIAIPNTLSLDDVFVADQQGDTLLFLASLDVDVRLLALLNNTVNVSYLKLETLKAKVERGPPGEDFNFQFIIDAFAGDDAETPADTAAATPWDIKLGHLVFTDIYAKYYDATLGFDALLDLGNLDVEMKEADLAAMRFLVDEIKLENTQARYVQWEVADNTTENTANLDSTSSSLPDIGFNRLSLNNIDLRFRDSTSKMEASLVLGDFYVEAKHIDLNQQIIDLHEINIQNTQASHVMASETTSAKTDTLKTQTPANTKTKLAFAGGWKVALDELMTENLDLDYNDVSMAKSKGILDYNHLQLSDLNLQIDDIVLNDEEVRAKVERVSFLESGGFNLTKLAANLELTHQEVKLQELVFESEKSKLTGDFRAGFNDIEALSSQSGETALDINLSPSRLNTNEMFYLAGITPRDSLYRQYRNLNIRLAASLEGKIDKLHIRRFEVGTLAQTQVVSHGMVRNITKPELMQFDMVVDKLKTGRRDLLRLLDTAIFAGINIPDTIRIKANAAGKVDSINAGISLASNFGNMEAKAFYQAPGKSKPDSVWLFVNSEKLDVGRFLGDTSLGVVSLTSTILGGGFQSGAIIARVQGVVAEAEFNGYSYNNIAFEGGIRKDTFDLVLNSTDPNLDFSLDASGTIDTTGIRAQSQLSIKLLNLKALHFTSQNIALQSDIALDIDYVSVEDMTGEIDITNARLLMDEDLVSFEPITIKPELSPDSTILIVDSEILELDFKSNYAYTEIAEAMQAAARKYLGLADTVGLEPDKWIAFNMDFKLPDNIRTYLTPGLESIRFDTVFGSYQSNNNRLKFDLGISEVHYDGIELENFNIDLDGINDSIEISAGFDRLAYDTLATGKFAMDEIINKGKMKSILSFSDIEGNPEYFLKNEIYFSDTAIRIAVADSGLMLNGERWETRPDNFLLISDAGIFTRDFIFRHKEQKIEVLGGAATDSIIMENFELANLLNILGTRSEKNAVEGKLNLNLALPRLDTLAGVAADISIDDFVFLQTPIGKLKFNLSESEENLNLFFSLVNNKNSITAEGVIEKSVSPQNLDIDLGLNIDDPEWFEAFSLGEISQTEGRISGKIKVLGNTESPEIEGLLQFNNTRMRIDQLNLMAHFNKETIRFNNQGIVFDKFTIEDVNSNSLVLDGRLLTSNYQDFAFDLHVNASNFQAINSTKKDNETFYGSLILDAIIHLNGDMDLPVVDADITIKEGTDLSYELPGSEIEMVSSEGVVYFDSPASGFDTLFVSQKSENITDSILSKFQGIDLSAKLEIDSKSRFTMVIDPHSGDYAWVSGSALLNFTMDPSGSQTLTGVYEVSDGEYQLSFYGLVKRTFKFRPGSSIAWSGNIMDANLDFTAKHIVKTNSLALVMNESTGLTDAEQNAFRQRLPYEVLLNLKGFISEPDVSFNITLPDKYLVNYPAVASKLTMLNSGQNDSELNKQVFALLVTGSFLADSPFASTGGGGLESFATTAARNSVNGILADQLNKLSNKYVKGVELNFGLTSYENYSASSSDVRTELDVQVSKKLLNDRLTIEASGSFDVEGERQYTGGNTSYSNGEFSATYALTENGEYKLKAYRENAYDLFDGEVAYSGVAFIIEKSFNALFKRRNDKKQKPAGENKNPSQ